MSDVPVAPESPQNLLAQMERMLAALNADLDQLDADLQPSAQQPAPSITPSITPEADRA
ncbi:hypothetical protein [Streptacidiphilus rugosus]|uniref:hypothetical protein n=1 Tax=Streptacidiphilus rugosus TaxID=405783 RepID=UPI000AF08011|nr:hypothetical protein [Streptacidiphilus rugosus]